MKARIFLVLAVLAALGVAVGFYLTRPPSAPSKDSTQSTASTLSQFKTEENDVFVVDAAQSSVQFEIDEILNSKPTHVVGVTNQVSGEVLVNAKKPSASKMGKISINARTFKTDNERRNGAIARLILKSEDPANEFITFESTALNGLPAELKQGEEFSFTIDGNLTVSGVTKPATFTVVAKLSGDQLTGTAVTTIMRPDFGLKIPNLSFLAGVDEDVLLKFQFVAKK